MRTLPATSTPVRVLALWWPGWSLIAAREAAGTPPEAPLAVVSKSIVVARSAAAAAEGVTEGLRIRHAQARCPDLQVLTYDVGIEQRAFEPVLRIIETHAPLVQVIRPGLAAVRAGGLTRFYGSEAAAADVLAGAVQEEFEHDVRIAVADGLFAAEHAAYATTGDVPWRQLPPGESARFLARLPVTVLAPAIGDSRMPNTLRRLGIRHLGDLAALPRSDVHARFAAAGLHAHQLACGHDAPTISPRSVPLDLDLRIVCDPPTVDIEPLIAHCTAAVDRLVTALMEHALICNQIRLALHTEGGLIHEKLWRHPWQFTAGELLDRIRWQLDEFAAETSERYDAISLVTMAPESLESASHHAEGLWGDRPDEHVVRTITQLQARLGHDAVLSASVGGGRLLDERRVLRPWGEAVPAPAGRRTDQPWPGSLPGLSPATVFAQAQPGSVRGADGSTVRVSERGSLSTPPATLQCSDAPARHIAAWAGPWPIQQRWWRNPLTVHRFQFVDDCNQAWLLLTGGGLWWVEARYD
ncbi:DNA polymerase Y family protein [Dermatophilaceae bacterium Sec6.4]